MTAEASCHAASDTDQKKKKFEFQVKLLYGRNLGRPTF